MCGGRARTARQETGSNKCYFLSNELFLIESFLEKKGLNTDNLTICGHVLLSPLRVESVLHPKRSPTFFSTLKTSESRQLQLKHAGNISGSGIEGGHKACGLGWADAV